MVTLSGMVMPGKDVQLQNAYVPIEVRLPPSVIDAKFGQSLNTKPEREVKLSGKVTDVRLLQ